MAYLYGTPGKNIGNQGMQRPPVAQGAGTGPDAGSSSNQPQEWTGFGNGSVPFGNGNSAQAGSAASNVGAIGHLGTGIVGAAGDSRCAAGGGATSGLHGTNGGGLGATAVHVAQGGASSELLYGMGGGRSGTRQSRAGATSACHQRMADSQQQAYPLGQDDGYEALPPHSQPEQMASQQLQQQALDLNMGVIQHQLNEMSLNSASAVAAPALASAGAARHERAEQELDVSNVYVSHLPNTMTRDDFLAFMSKFGTVLSCRMLHGQTWLSKGVKGVGFARMANSEEAARAVQAVNGMELPGHDFQLHAKLAYKTNRDIPPETPRVGTNGRQQPRGHVNLPRAHLVSHPYQGGTMHPAARGNRPRMAAPAGVGPRVGSGNNPGFHPNQRNPLLGNNFLMDMNELAVYFQNVALPNCAGGSGGAWAQHGFGGIQLPPLPAGPNNHPGYGVNTSPNVGGINQFLNGAQGPGGAGRHGEQQQQNLQNPGFKHGMDQDMEQGCSGSML